MYISSLRRVDPISSIRVSKLVSAQLLILSYPTTYGAHVLLDSNFYLNDSGGGPTQRGGCLALALLCGKAKWGREMMYLLINVYKV